MWNLKNNKQNKMGTGSDTENNLVVARGNWCNRMSEIGEDRSFQL